MTIDQRRGVVRIENLERNVDEFAKRFAEASPFPHIVLDDVIRAEFDDVGFPDMKWDGWYRSPERYQHNKVTCKDGQFQ